MKSNVLTIIIHNHVFYEDSKVCPLQRKQFSANAARATLCTNLTGTTEGEGVVGL